MERSKENAKQSKFISSEDADQLMVAIREIDKSIAHLRKLLQNSVRAHTQAQTKPYTSKAHTETREEAEQLEEILPPKTFH